MENKEKIYVPKMSPIMLSYFIELEKAYEKMSALNNDENFLEWIDYNIKMGEDVCLKGLNKDEKFYFVLGTFVGIVASNVGD